MICYFLIILMILVLVIGEKMGNKYDEIISEIKGDLSEEEIYSRANESLHEDFLFLQESGLLNKDELLQFIKKMVVTLIMFWISNVVMKMTSTLFGKGWLIFQMVRDT